VALPHRLDRALEILLGARQELDHLVPEVALAHDTIEVLSDVEECGVLLLRPLEVGPEPPRKDQ